MAIMSLESRSWIGNEFVYPTGQETYTVKNPADDSDVGTFTICNETDVNHAVRVARTAFEGEWASFTGAQRGACMRKFADLLENNGDRLSEIESMSMGMPISLMKGVVLPLCASTFRYYAGLAEQVQGESFPLENNSYRIVQYEPIGVCAGIAVWNFTFVFLAWKIAPAVAAGNTCIFKPSEKSPFAMLAVAPLFAEAGFPPGVVNFVCGDGSTGALLASHMDIDKIAFTGSTAVGRAVQVAAAKSNLKKVTLELGGKSPAVIFEDADIQNAVANFAQGLLFNSGQVCFTTSRLLLHESIADTFIQALKQAFDGAAGAMGDQMKEETQLGPLVDRKQFERVLGFLESGKSEAELVVGGARKGDKGCFVQPTIFLNPKENAKIYREEIFGPVVAATVFDTEEEAINMANDSAFGLSACIYTENMSRALRVSRKIRAGTIAINSSFLPDNNTPFGGYKQSGYGRESGMEGLKAYLQAKTIKIAVKPS